MLENEMPVTLQECELGNPIQYLEEGNILRFCHKAILVGVCAAMHVVITK